MIEVILRFTARDPRSVTPTHEICDTLRRTAHAIEGKGALRPGDFGPILDRDLAEIGVWSLSNE